MLSLQNIEVVYSDVIQVLRGISLEVGKGKIIALLGANGAGKTTTLKAISGLLYTQEGEISRGNISFENQTINRMSPEKIVRLGIVQVLEGRRLFNHLTVEENIFALEKYGGSLNLTLTFSPFLKKALVSNPIPPLLKFSI